MFTGIVAGTGTLRTKVMRDGDVRVRIDTPALLTDGCDTLSSRAALVTDPLV